MRFNLFDHPLVAMAPDYLRRSGAWAEHIPLAFLLIDLARPKTLVELGTWGGTSYCAFCQAVASLRLPTRCWAVDTWKGDQHTGEYGQEVLRELRVYHDPRYGSFSQLVQATFDETVERFADGSIDLLHIDGLHTYEAVRHDYQTWRPKMSDTGIVLFHDTSEREGGFGVYKLWEELEGQFPSFAFQHGHGLGVLGVGKNLPPQFLVFLEEARSNPQSMRSLFATLGRASLCVCKMGLAVTMVFAQQADVNAYKRQFGESVDPPSEDFPAAIFDPITYVEYTVGEVRALLRCASDLRRQLETWKNKTC